MAEKSLNVKNVAEAKAACGDLKVVGNGDKWRLAQKAMSDSAGFMKSTKYSEVEGLGVSVQTTSEIKVRDENGNLVSHVISDTSHFVPGAKVVDDVNDGLKLVKI